MSLGLLTLHLQFPGCASLKEKRGHLKPLLARLHREFNISVAELDYQDSWQDSLIGCALLSSDPTHTRRSLQVIPSWIETHHPDITLLSEHIESL